MDRKNIEEIFAEIMSEIFSRIEDKRFRLTNDSEFPKSK